LASICSSAFISEIDRDLVEHQKDDGRRRVDVRDSGVHGLREDEAFDFGVEQEGGEKDQRRRGEDRQKRPHDLDAPGGDGERDPDHDRADYERGRAVDAAAFQRLHAEDRAEEAEERVVHNRGVAPRDELDDDLDGEQDQRGREGDDEREEHDVARRRAANGEELDVLAEDVEERLREREPRDGEQLSSTNGRLAEAVGCLGAGLSD
jgi:hypothetical protein